MPATDVQVAAFFDEIGFECLRVHGFKCVGAVEIAHVTEEMAEAAIREVDGDDIDCIVQCGTNLSFVAVADRMESVIGKPIIPINAATLCARHRGKEGRAGEGAGRRAGSLRHPPRAATDGLSRSRRTLAAGFALRENGIMTPMHGCSRLCREF